MALQPGTRLGHYEIVSQLGTGGMGDVYRSKDLNLGRQVAIKVLRGRNVSDEIRLKRFKREARTASSLNHPNIVTIYDIGIEGSTHYIAMEYVEGRTIRQLLIDETLPIGKVVDFSAQIAGGLAKAHLVGVVHRDLKPENLMVTADGFVKILDFGLAKLSSANLLSDKASDDAGGEKPETQPGTVLGTVGYLSPEQAKGLPVDFQADQFSLGTIIYEMATGRAAFLRETEVLTLAAIIEKEPHPILDLAPDVPHSFAAVVERCLSKDPAGRYATTLDLASDLKRLQRSFMHAPETPVPTPETARERNGMTKARGVAYGTSISTRAGHAGLPTVLVLPFDMLPSESKHDYFSDGLTDEIITDLSRIRGLRVISRTSAAQLKGTKKDIRTLGRELNVQYVLEGSVRTAGNSLRVTSKLVDARSDELQWAEKYSGSLEDIFDIQETISRKIVDALQLQLSAGEDRRLGERPISDVHAFEYYLRAKQEIFRFKADALERALEYLHKGIDLIGENVLLYSAMGYVYWQYVNAGISGDRAYLDEAAACAQKILGQDPESPHGHRLLGLIGMHGGTSEDAARHLKRALANDPNDTDSLLWLTLFYGFRGKTGSGYPLANRLLRIDPLTPFHHMLPGFLALMNGEFERALPPFRKAHEMDPGNPIVLLTYGQILAMSRRLDEAYRCFDGLRASAPNSFFANLGLVYELALRGDKESALRSVSKDLEEAAGEDLQYSWTMAHCFSLLGEKETSIRWLANAVDQGFFNYPLLSKLDPFLEEIRGEPAFERLMEDVRRQWEDFEA